MAVTSFYFSHIPVQKSKNPTTDVYSKIVKLKHSHFPLKKRPDFLVKSSFKNVVFEDRSEGVICYVDDSGEITCEGYDEGPRFHNQAPKIAYYPRDAETIINLLQLRLLQTVSSNRDDNGVTALNEYFMFNTNGFNKFC